MEKITFEDYPNTTTPINSTNLNNLQDNVETEINTLTEKNIITIKTTDNISQNVSTTWADYQISLNSTLSSVGSKLTLSNGGIKIGSGVHHVKVAGCVFEKGISSTLIAGIVKNSTRVCYGYESTTSSGQFVTLSFSPMVLDVQENDIFKLFVGSSVTGTITVSNVSTNLTIEVID